MLLAGFGTLYAAGGHAAKVKLGLTATTAAPGARGKSRLIVKGSKHGKFSVLASHLAPNKSYDLVVGGVKVGVIQTSANGGGRSSFNTTPGGKDALLGFDPRGNQIVVRDEDSGDDVLVGDMPEGDATETACCVADGEGEQECEDMTLDDCTNAGGMPIGVPGGSTAVSCLPDPCSTTPPEGESIACCTNATHDDESEAECEDVSTEAECSALGGTVVQAASCDPNPCQATPPSNAAACCVTHSEDGSSEIECEVRSGEACSAVGGTQPGAANCDADPCGSGSGDGSGDDGGGD